MDKVKELKELLQMAHRVVAITGAGISTESGIPDFRSQTGIYHTLTTPLIFSPWFIKWFPNAWYRILSPVYMKMAKAKPNKGHMALARLQTPERRVDIATQNVDKLHQEAGSAHVYELHGSLGEFRCMRCGAIWCPSQKALIETAENRRAEWCGCGGVLRPDITMFGEPLPSEPLRKSKLAMLDADIVLVIGTSLKVRTGLDLLAYRVKGTPVVVINREATGADSFADIVIHDAIGEVLDEVC